MTPNLGNVKQVPKATGLMKEAEPEGLRDFEASTVTPRRQQGSAFRIATSLLKCRVFPRQTDRPLMTGRVVAVTGTGEAGHTGGLCEGWGGPHRIQGREPLVAVPPAPGAGRSPQSPQHRPPARRKQPRDTT